MPIYTYFLCCQQICSMNYISLEKFYYIYLLIVYVCIKQHMWMSEDSLQVSVPTFHYVGLKLSQSYESCKF